MTDAAVASVVLLLSFISASCFFFFFNLSLGGFHYLCLWCFDSTDIDENIAQAPLIKSK